NPLGQNAGRAVSPNAKLKGYSWAIIRGVIPFKKQLTEFEDAFSDVGHVPQEGDNLVYSGSFVIERAEVPPGKIESPDKLKWQELDKAAIGKIVKEVFASSNSVDVVDPTYVDPVLTF